MKKLNSIHIQEITHNKKQYLNLLLLGDEQESMIDRYLERGEMFALFSIAQSEPIGIAVVTDEGKGICELKNIAIDPKFQRKGYGKAIINYLCRHYKHRFQTISVGTGNSLQTTSFYKNCGFCYSHTIKDFFTDNYDHIIIEEGEILTDMIYFKKQLKDFLSN